MIVLVKDINLVKKYEYHVQIHKSDTFSCVICKLTSNEYKKQIIKDNVVQADKLEWFLKIILLSMLPEVKGKITIEQYDEIEESLLNKHE